MKNNPGWQLGPTLYSKDGVNWTTKKPKPDKNAQTFKVVDYDEANKTITIQGASKKKVKGE